MFIKSALYYTLFRKYGKRLIFVIINIMFILLIDFIHMDVVEYLTLNEMKANLIYALLAKWGLVLSSMGLITYSIATAFRQTNEIIDKTPMINPIRDNVSKVEKDVKSKRTLKSHGDMIIEELKKNK